MIRVHLKSNAKTIEGTHVPFSFYEDDVYIVSKTHKTYIIRCKNLEVEVLHEAIKNKIFTK